MVRGRTTTIGLADCHYEPFDRFAPFVVEGGSEQPSRLNPAVLDRITGLVAEAAGALGIQHGTVQGDLVVGPRGPVLVDMVAHLPGGYVCTHEIPLSTGVNFVAAAIRLALGEEPEAAALRPRWKGGVARRHFFPSLGTVVAVHGTAEAATGDGVALLELGVVPGARVSGMTSCISPAGVVIAVGDTREQAVARAEAAAARVQIVTQAAGPADTTFH